jgi:hypothetical protein
LLRQSLQTQVNYFPPTQLLPSFDDLIGQIPTSLSVDNQSHIFLEDNNSIQEFED